MCLSLAWITGLFFPTAPIQAKIAAASSTRTVVPFVWAHHDDFTFIGKPYTPFPNLYSQLDSLRVNALGIIHWTTRPLDLYFKNTLEQLWSRTRNQPLANTCDEMASHSFVGQDAKRMSAYLLDWMQTAPMFGRETSDFFMDKPLKDPDDVIRNCDRRLGQLKQINPATTTEEGRKLLTYFSRHEQFVKSFFTVQHAVEKSVSLKKAGDLTGAAKLVEALQPQQVIEQYAALSTTMPITKGEEGVLITLNTRWLPYVLGQQQAVGSQPARFTFQPTVHEALAQLPGKNTYFFDRAGLLWRSLGEKETGAIIALNQTAQDEHTKYGILINKPVSLSLKTIGDSLFASGTYQVTLRLTDQTQQAGQASSLSVTLQSDNETASIADLVYVLASSKQHPQAVTKTYTIKRSHGKVDLTIVPKSGSVLVHSIVVQRVQTE